MLTIEVASLRVHNLPNMQQIIILLKPFLTFIFNFLSPILDHLKWYATIKYHKTIGGIDNSITLFTHNITFFQLQCDFATVRNSPLVDFFPTLNWLRGLVLFIWNIITKCYNLTLYFFMIYFFVTLMGTWTGLKKFFVCSPIRSAWRLDVYLFIVDQRSWRGPSVTVKRKWFLWIHSILFLFRTSIWKIRKFQNRRLLLFNFQISITKL